MARAISYIRFSSVGQGRGSTTERQQEMIGRWLQDHPDVGLSPVSSVDMGRSGYHGEHLQHGLGKIIKAIEDDLIKDGDYILVEAIDRIGRLEPDVMMGLILDILRAGVTIVTLEDGQEYTKTAYNNNIGTVFMLIGKIDQAHQYSRNLSRRLSASWDSRRRKAREGQAYKKSNRYWLDGEGKLIPDRAEAVRELIDLYLKGYGVTRILREITPKYPDFPDLHQRTLKRWMANPALIGTWLTNEGESIENALEALIDHGTYYRLQRETARRSKNMSPESSYKTSGLLRCALCDSPFAYRRQKNKNTGQYIVYTNCKLFLSKGAEGCSNTRTWPYEVALYALESKAPEQLNESVLDEKLAVKQSQVDAMEEEVRAIDTQIDNAFDLLISFPNQSNLQNKIKKLNEQKETLLEKIQNEQFYILAANEEFWPWGYEEEFDVFESMDTESYLSDPIAMREKLKQTSFRMNINHSTMSVVRGTSKDERYTLIKRSTRHNCYLVRHYIEPHGEYIEEENLHVDYEGVERWLAINRKGLVTSASDRMILEKNLEDIKQRVKEGHTPEVEFEISQF